MKAAKVREMDQHELETQSREVNEQMFRLRLQINMGQTEGLKKYRTLRRDRARIQTILRERKMAAEG